MADRKDGKLPTVAPLVAAYDGNINLWSIHDKYSKHF
jgi:hypothetical protein